MNQHKVKWSHISQLDGTYQGLHSFSYKKQGFGIFMDSNFDTYMGSFKNNLLHNLGLIIFRNGTMMYTHFNRNIPDTLRVLKTKDRMVVGTFKENKMHGIGFEYVFEEFVWRMGRWVGGEMVEELGEEEDKLGLEPPRMMTIEQGMYRLCESFMKKSVFDGMEYQYYHKEGEEEILGLMIEGRQEGLGVVLRKNELVQAGVFYNGLLDGYCLQVSPSHYEIGYFSQGLRHGIIQLHSSNDTTVFHYQHDTLLKQLKGKASVTALKQYTRQKRQSQWNFLNVRNNFTLNDFYPLGAVSNSIGNYEGEKKYVKLSLSKGMSKSIVGGKSPKVETPKNRYWKYEGLKREVGKEENEEGMSCLEFVKRNAHLFLGEGERGRKARMEELEVEEEVAVEENPLM